MWIWLFLVGIFETWMNIKWIIVSTFCTSRNLPPLRKTKVKTISFNFVWIKHTLGSTQFMGSDFPYILKHKNRSTLCKSIFSFPSLPLFHLKACYHTFHNLETSKSTAICQFMTFLWMLTTFGSFNFCLLLQFFFLLLSESCFLFRPKRSWK